MWPGIRRSKIAMPVLQMPAFGQRVSEISISGNGYCQREQTADFCLSEKGQSAPVFSIAAFALP